MDSRRRDRLRSTLPALCVSIVVILIGAVGLLGWVFDIETFKQFLHHGISMKANTAVALVLAGLSLCLFILDQEHRWSRRLGQGCAAMVLIIGALSLSEHVVGWNLEIDQIVFHEPPGQPGSLSPGRPGPPASLCLLLSGVALLLLHSSSKRHSILLQALAIGIGLIAAPGLIGYAYGAESLYGIAQYTAIAFHTALALVLLAAGILFAYPKNGVISLVYDQGIGGSTARRLLPPAILLPLVLGWLRLRGEEHGYFVAAFGTALMMLIMITLLSSLVLETAAANRHSERRQRLSEDILVTANQDLERRVTERTGELRAAFRYARSLLEASLDPLVTISPEGKITDVNKATELVTGVSHERLIGSDFSNYFTRPHKAKEGYLKVFEEGFVRDYPLTIRHTSGRTTDVLYNATIYRNEAGEVQGVFAAARDVTDRQKAEQALRESEQRYRTLFDTIDEGFCVIEMLHGSQGKPLDYLFLEINPAFEKQTGLEQALGKTMRELIPEHDEHWFQIYDKVARTGEAVRFENRATAMNRWFAVYAFRLGGAESRKVALLFNNITERKRMEDELRAKSHYSRSLLEASLDPLVTISPEGNITDVNQATELATGVARKDLVGSVFSSYFTEPKKADDGYRKVMSQGFVRDYPLTIRHISGSTMDVLYNAVVYKNEAGEMQGVFAAARDITERKRAEEELDHYREHLEEMVAQRTKELSRSNRDLEQFAYAASHDLQEPLRMIAGYLQLLSDRYKGHLDEKADKYINYSVDGAQRMSTLIRDLLEFSRVNTRGEELRNVDCNKAFESAVRNLGSAIAESGATITHDSLPVVRADQTQLTQLFQNLIGNAVKFRAPDRRPQIHVSAQKEQDHWLFRVQDNGIGFEQQYEDKIFLIFQRLHGRGQYPGTGIGLAICKRIIERHGGGIWAASEPGKGTTFSFSIPI